MHNFHSFDSSCRNDNTQIFCKFSFCGVFYCNFASSAKTYFAFDYWKIEVKQQRSLYLRFMRFYFIAESLGVLKFDWNVICEVPENIYRILSFTASHTNEISLAVNSFEPSCLWLKCNEAFGLKRRSCAFHEIVTRVNLYPGGTFFVYGVFGLTSLS